MIEAVDILGNVTMGGYSERGALLWTEDEDGNPTDYTYDEVNDVLVSVTGPDPDGGGPLARPVTSYRYDEKAIGTSGAGPALEGLQASYYENANLAGRPKARQTDASVDFDWGTGGPAALPGRTDEFSVRWTGNVLVTTPGEYLFSTVSDDGTRLIIDAVHAIDDWADPEPSGAVYSEPVTLTAGMHKIVLDYYEGSGTADVELRWTCPTCSPALAEQVVPSSALRPSWLNHTSVVSPAGRVAFSHFAGPASAQPDYDLVKLADGTNVITSYTYDTMGRLTQKVMPKGNAARTIDSEGNLQGSPDPAFATAWTYYGLTETAVPPAACGGGAVSQAGLPKSKTPYGIATTTTVYDAAGRPFATTSGAGTTCLTYDGDGRLASEKAPTTYGGSTYETITYTYDPAGAERTASNGILTNTTEYDEAGRPKKEVDSFGAEATFTYDVESNLIGRTATPSPPSPSYTTSYAYDDAGQMTSLSDPAARTYGFTYDKHGNLKTTQYPNGTFTWADYNAAGWLTNLYHRHGTLPAPLPGSVPADPSPLVEYAYSYDVEGRKTQEVRSGGGLATETTNYTLYDNLGRLAQLTLPDGTCRKYLFDLDSNRTEIKEGATCAGTSIVETYSYSTGALDQLASVTKTGQAATTFSHKSGGELATRGADTLTWDGRGRQSGGTFAGTSLAYGFDPDGFRRERVSGGETTRYLGAGLFETNGVGTITVSDIDGPAGDLSTYAGPPQAASTVTYRYYDGHGNVAAEADQTGVRTAAYAYDPFGSLRAGSASANATSERFTGRWDKKFDSSSGLIQMGVRPYDPALGRFLAIDPVEGGAFNGYDSALQDPINAYDLDGRVVFIQVAIVAARVISIAAPVVARAAISRFGSKVKFGPSASQSGLYHSVPRYAARIVLRGGKRTVDADGVIKFTAKMKFGGRRGRMEVFGRYQRNPDTGEPYFHVFHKFFNPRPRPNLPE